jgi:hypothetical protein
MAHGQTGRQPMRHERASPWPVTAHSATGRRSANRPGHHGRRSTRPAAWHALPVRERHAGEEGMEGGAVGGESWTGAPNMPGRRLLPLEAGSQLRLNLPVPLTHRPPAITDGCVQTTVRSIQSAQANTRRSSAVWIRQIVALCFTVLVVRDPEPLRPGGSRLCSRSERASPRSPRRGSAALPCRATPGRAGAPCRPARGAGQRGAGPRAGGSGLPGRARRDRLTRR